MHRFSTLSLFLLSVTLLVAVFGVGLGNAQKDETTTDVGNNGLSILPVPDDSSTSSAEEPTVTSKEDTPTVTSEPETSTTEKAPPTLTTSTSESTTEEKPTNTPKPPPPTTSTSTTSEPSKTSQKDNGPTTTSSKRLTTTVMTVSGTTVQKTVPAPEPTGDNSNKPTEAPGLNPGEKDDDSDSGLDDSQKNIIIGVVVGVGGAILLGGLAVVAWRVWGRKKNDGYGEEDEDMMNAGTAVGSAGRDKASSPSNAGNSPFKSTLDQYHNPGPVNASSNF